ncbi:hypothetical protein HK100_006129, partial [Physocladia obscura]
MQAKKRGPKPGFKEYERLASMEQQTSNISANNGIRAGSVEGCGSNFVHIGNSFGDNNITVNGSSGISRSIYGNGNALFSVSSSTPLESSLLDSTAERMHLLVQEASKLPMRNAIADVITSSINDSLVGNTSIFGSVNNSDSPLAINDPQHFSISQPLAGDTLFNTQFDFGESLFSFQSIIGQSFFPSTNWNSTDTLTNILDSITSPVVSVGSFGSKTAETHISPILGSTTLTNNNSNTSATTSYNVTFNSTNYTLNILEQDLVKLFFSHISLKVYLFHEPYFLANLYPVNKHPSYLIFAICAVASLFSAHSDILAFGTTHNAAGEYTGKSMSCIDGMERISDLNSDCIEVIQSLMLLALVEYGFNQPEKAYRKMVQAIQMAIRLKIDIEDPNVAMNPLSVWVDKTIFYSPDKLLARRKLWEFCLYFDTCVGLVGGLPLVIHEAAYSYLLSPPNTQDAETQLNTAAKIKPERTEKIQQIKAQLENEREKMEQGLQYFRNILENPPSATIFNEVGIPVKPRPLCIYDRYHVIMNQLCFILRRVIRMNYTVRTTKQNYNTTAITKLNSSYNPGLAIVQSLIPPPQDTVLIHDALIDFYHSLPPEYKPFKSFTQFYPVSKCNQEGDNSGSGSNSDFHPGFASDFDPTQIHVISIITNLICGVVMLHLPRTDNMRAAFKLDSIGCGQGNSASSERKVASAEVLLIARKAMVFLVQGFLPADVADKDTPVFGDVSGSGDINACVGVQFVAGNSDRSGIRKSRIQDGRDDEVDPTFATRADKTVHSFLGEHDGSNNGGGGGGESNSANSITAESLFDSSELQQPTWSRIRRQSISARQEHPLEANVGLFCDPVVGYNIFSVSVAGIAVASGGSNEEFSSEALNAMERTIENVDLRVMDLITFVWPVCASLSERLKRVVEVASRKRQERK